MNKKKVKTFLFYEQINVLKFEFLVKIKIVFNLRGYNYFVSMKAHGLVLLMGMRKFLLFFEFRF